MAYLFLGFALLHITDLLLMLFYIMALAKIRYTWVFYAVFRYMGKFVTKNFLDGLRSLVNSAAIPEDGH